MGEGGAGWQHRHAKLLKANKSGLLHALASRSLPLSGLLGLSSRFVVVLSISSRSPFEEKLVVKGIGLQLVLTFANNAGFL